MKVITLTDKEIEDLRKDFKESAKLIQTLIENNNLFLDLKQNLVVNKDVNNGNS